jgi:MFS family permease
MKTLINLEANTRHNLVILFGTGLLFWVSMTCLLPVLPAYIEDIGGTIQQVGLVMGCFAIGLLSSRTWLGHLADTHSRKIVIIIGTIVVTLSPLSYLLATSVPILMVLRAFHGISIAAFTTGYSALVIDLAPPKNKGEVIGYMSLAVPIGMAIGPALGGFLESDFGYAVLFIFSACAGVISFVLALKISENKEESSSNLNISNINTSTIWQLIRKPALFIPALIMLLIGLVFGTLASFLPLYIRAENIALNAGLFYTAAAIASFVVRVFVGKASDRIGRGVFITMSLFLYLTSMILLALAKNPGLFIIAAIAEGSGAGILIPMMLALIADRSYPHERGRVTSVCVGGFDLGIALAGPILGTLSMMINYSAMFSLAGIFAFSALIVFITQSNKNIRHSFGFALGKENDGYAHN